MIKVVLFFLLIAGFGQGSFSNPLGGDPQKGELKSVTCKACHGQEGISPNPLWPNLKGQQFDYLVKQLRDYKSGLRKDPLMGPQALTLSDEDILNLSAYFNQMK